MQSTKGLIAIPAIAVIYNPETAVKSKCVCMYILQYL